MPHHRDYRFTPIDDSNVDQSIKSGMEKSKKTVDYKGEPNTYNRHGLPTSGKERPSLVSGTDLTDYTQMLEAMDKIEATVKGTDTLEDDEIGDVEDNSEELFAKLDKLYLPGLILQSYESSVSESVKKDIREAQAFTERNNIQFDMSSRMAQLVRGCALLLQQKKNTKNYQMFVKASKIRREADLNMQKEEAESAKDLAQKYLVHVATMNPNQAARDAATKLLPITQRD